MDGPTRTAIITHITQAGRQLRMCTRCQLVVGPDGKPNPTWYSAEFIKRFNESPEEKCKHVLSEPKTMLYLQGEGV